MHNDSWKKIFDDYDILKHDFSKTPFIITAEQIKKSTHSFKNTGEKEVRILCKQDCRQDRADVFIKNKLFLLPIKNGTFAIIKGEGYLDIDLPPKKWTQRKVGGSITTGSKTGGVLWMGRGISLSGLTGI